MKRSIFPAVMAMLLGLTGAGLFWAPAAQADDGEVTLSLVTINDFHGQLDEHLVQWAATVEQLLNDPSAQGSLLVGAGDYVSKSVPASAEQDDNPTIDVLNKLGMDVAGLGNHELDHGYADLTERIMARADFPIIAANVEKADGSPALAPFSIVPVAGVRVGFIGAVTRETPTLTPEGTVAGLTFTDPVAAVNRTVDQFNGLPEAERPDVMIVLAHEGAPTGWWSDEELATSDTDFARLVNNASADIDAIVTGHSHKRYARSVPVPGDPTRTRPVIQAGEHGEFVGQVKLTVQTATGEVTSHQAQTFPRSTESEASLVNGNQLLTDLAALRDEAEAYAIDRIAQREAAQTNYDAAVADAEEAKTALEAATGDYEAATAVANQAYTESASIKSQIDAAVAEGNAAYGEAADIKSDYQTAYTESQEAYAEAADLKAQYQALIADGKAAYGEAARIKQEYQDAIAEGNAAYGEAATLKTQYQGYVVEYQQAYTQAVDLKGQHDAAWAEGWNAYATAAGIWGEYSALRDGEDFEGKDEQLASLMEQYETTYDQSMTALGNAATLKTAFDEAMTTLRTAHDNALALRDPFNSAMATATAAYTRAQDLKAPFDAAMATAEAAYNSAEALKAPFDAAMASAGEAYTRAQALVQPFNTAMAAAEAAYTIVDQLRPTYEAAVAAVHQAEAVVVEVKAVYDAALEVWHQALATVDQLKITLLTLL